jgi:hypothetical protein
MTQKIKIVVIGLIVWGAFLAGGQAFGAGLVPCGGQGEPACNLCHFFVLIDNIIDFLLFRLVPPLALLFIIIGGAMFLLGAGSPRTITQGKNIITSVLIGIGILYGGYFLIGLILQSIGLSQWTHDIYHTWWEQGFFTVPCQP